MEIASPIIDWLQFTAPVDAGAGRAFLYVAGNNPAAAMDGIFNMLVAWGMPEGIAAALAPSGATATGATPPYNTGLTASGVTWYLHSESPHVDTLLCQITGTGCAYLRGLDMLEGVMSWVHTRVSRIDVAIDIKTSAPLESLFTTTKRLSYINSKSGQTYYIGSMKSDKYARFYRYGDNHPRAAFARLECIYRRKFASEACRAVLERGLERAMADMIHSNKITLSSALSAAIGEGERLRVAPPVNTGAEGTLRWLIGTAMPALRRLVSEGVITDLEGFIAEHVKGETS